MRTALALVAILYVSAAFAQSAPPTVGGKPLVQVQPQRAVSAPKSSAPKSSAPKSSAPKSSVPKSRSVAQGLQACLEIEDGSKGRLDCYDAVVPPKPKPKPPAAKGVLDCRFFKEQDERLTCFNGFAESIPRLPRS